MSLDIAAFFEEELQVCTLEMILEVTPCLLDLQREKTANYCQVYVSNAFGCRNLLVAMGRSRLLLSGLY